MTDTAMDQETFRITWGERDCWPFVRICIVAMVLGAAAERFAGWSVDPRHLLALPRQMLGVLSILAMISFALAEAYLLVFAIPIYVVGVLNDWSYDATHSFCRVVLGVRSRPFLALGALCGEIALFVGLAALLLRVL